MGKCESEHAEKHCAELRPEASVSGCRDRNGEPNGGASGGTSVGYDSKERGFVRIESLYRASDRMAAGKLWAVRFWSSLRKSVSGRRSGRPDQAKSSSTSFLTTETALGWRILIMSTPDWSKVMAVAASHIGPRLTAGPHCGASSSVDLASLARHVS